MKFGGAQEETEVGSDNDPREKRKKEKGDKAENMKKRNEEKKVKTTLPPLRTALRTAPVSLVVMSPLVNQRRRTTFTKRATLCALTVTTTIGRLKTALCNI